MSAGLQSATFPISSTRLWKRPTRISAPLCKASLSHGEVTFLVLQHQLSLSSTGNKYEVTRIKLTMMSRTYYNEHIGTETQNMGNCCFSQQIRFTPSSWLKFDNDGATWRIHSTYKVVYQIQPFATLQEPTSPTYYSTMICRLPGNDLGDINGVHST